MTDAELVRKHSELTERGARITYAQCMVIERLEYNAEAWRQRLEQDDHVSVERTYNDAVALLDAAYTKAGVM